MDSLAPGLGGVYSGRLLWVVPELVICAQGCCKGSIPAFIPSLIAPTPATRAQME